MEGSEKTHLRLFTANFSGHQIIVNIIGIKEWCRSYPIVDSSDSRVAAPMHQLAVVIGQPSPTGLMNKWLFAKHIEVSTPLLEKFNIYIITLKILLTCIYWERVKQWTSFPSTGVSLPYSKITIHIPEVYLHNVQISWSKMLKTDGRASLRVFSPLCRLFILHVALRTSLLVI